MSPRNHAVRLVRRFGVDDALIGDLIERVKLRYLGDSKDSFKWDYHDYLATSA